MSITCTFATLLLALNLYFVKYCRINPFLPQWHMDASNSWVVIITYQIENFVKCVRLSVCLSAVRTCVRTYVFCLLSPTQEQSC